MFHPGESLAKLARVNQLCCGDNLNVRRESVKDESVDLSYLDPPLNSKRDYNLLFKSPKSVAAVCDRRHFPNELRSFGAHRAPLQDFCREFRRG